MKQAGPTAGKMASPNGAKAPSFFALLPAIFEKASACAGLETRFIRVSGYLIKIQFAGHAMVEKLLPALEHHSSEPSPSVDLTICVWDSASTGTTMPSPPWTREDYLERGEIRGYQRGSLRAYYDLGADVLNVLDADSGQGFFWIKDGDDLPMYMSGAPFLNILSGWFEARQLSVIHAGAVGYADGAVLITGKGGSGKSTACLSCLDSDLSYLSDDYTLYRLGERPTLFSLYGTGKKNTNDLSRVPCLVSGDDTADARDAEKSLFFLNRRFPEKLLAKSPLKALFVARISGRPETTLTPAPASAAFLACAPSSILQLSGAGQNSFQSLANLVRETPCYYLNSGSDATQIPETIGRFLKKGAGR